MSGFGVLADKLGVKVTLGNQGDAIYPPIPPSPSPSEESEPSADMAPIYTPLKRNEIRLLILNPGNKDEPINCFLENFPVAKPKPFAALSYVWGQDTPETRRSILLDGYPVTVTANLYAFLAQHRAEETCFVLWIDALCINQDDLVERAAQIYLMKRIYESAEEVIIWLGESNPAVDAAVSRMVDIHDSWWSPILGRTGSAHRSLATITEEDIGHLVRHSSSSSEPDESWKAGIQDILSRPWWSRIWVYQEATAPCVSGTQVLIGPHHMPLDVVLTVNQIIRSISWRGHSDPLFSLDQDGLVHPAAYVQTYSALRKRHQQTGRSRFLRLSDLLSALRRFDATNPRDKLYALIPTSLDGAELLDVSYDKPVEQVYAEATWSMIRAHGSLDILGHCSPPSQHDDDSATVPGLPSWVPNWMAKPAATPLFKRGLAALLPSAPKDSDSHGVHVDNAGVEIGKLYGASGNSVPEASVDVTGRILSCAGFLFDRISDVSPDEGDDMLGTNVSQTWAAWLRTIPEGRSQRVAQSLSGGALPRILVADCDRVAIDVGMRRGGKGSKAELAPALGESGNHNYYMDITGPHPASFHRRLIVTKKGYLGLAPEHVQTGDLVTIIMGSQVPLVLREAQQQYVFVGDAFIDGVMDSEAWAERDENEKKVFTI